MTRDELLGKLSEFLEEATLGEVTNVDPNTDLQGQTGLDSMGAVEFVILMENEFGLEKLSTDQASSIKTLNDAADTVLRKTENTK